MQRCVAVMLNHETRSSKAKGRDLGNHKGDFATRAKCAPGSKVWPIVHVLVTQDWLEVASSSSLLEFDQN